MLYKIGLKINNKKSVKKGTRMNLTDTSVTTSS